MICTHAMALRPLPLTLPWKLPFLGDEVNLEVVATGIYVVMIASLAAWLGTRRLRKVPGRAQALAELLASGLDRAGRAIFGRPARRWLPLLGTLFIFLWIGNLCGVARLAAFRLFGDPADGFGRVAAEEYADYNGNGRYDPGEFYVNDNANNRYDYGVPVPAPAAIGSDLNTALGLALVVGLVGLGARALRLRSLRLRSGQAGQAARREGRGISLAVALRAPLGLVAMSARLFGYGLAAVLVHAVCVRLSAGMVLPVGADLVFGALLGTAEALVFTLIAALGLAAAAGAGPEPHLEEQTVV